MPLICKTLPFDGASFIMLKKGDDMVRFRHCINAEIDLENDPAMEIVRVVEEIIKVFPSQTKEILEKVKNEIERALEVLENSNKEAKQDNGKPIR